MLSHKPQATSHKLLLFVIWCLVFGFFNNAYALNLDKAKTYFLKGDYKQAILEGEKILAGARRSSDLDELYYVLGLSYLKDGNYLRASDIFEIILKEFKNSAFQEEARLGLGDTCFLRGDYDKAQGYYKNLIESNPRTKLKAQGYYRLSQVGVKTGNTQLAREYLDKLKKEFPLNLEAKLSQELYNLSDIYYTVQVGSFSSNINAQNLTKKLTQKDYPAYVEETAFQGRTMYRVRVGKCYVRQEVEQLKDKLFQEGYPAKIFP